MQRNARWLMLAFSGFALAACSHKDKDAPLAFVPADTPYVVANLEQLDDDTRKAMLAQADAQLPAQVARMESAADDLATRDPDLARLLKAFAGELKNNTVEGFAKNAGLNLKGYSAIYGLGLSPVVRFQLTDAKAFDGFVDRLQKAYGKTFDTATVGGQSYRRQVSKDTGTEVILATVDQQAVAALLPVNTTDATLRQALGLDRPEKSLQDDSRLADLAKAKGYTKLAVGLVDFKRLLPLAASGKDPLFSALMSARAQAESAKTGEPVANQTAVPASCQTDAARIAERVPALSFGYTQLNAKHQDLRLDVDLASDITKAFSGLKVALPGLGMEAQAPFDLSLALPVAEMRGFWTAQSEAVAAKPFACPALVDLNDTFAKLGAAMQKAAIPPFGDMLGLHLALDSFQSKPPGTPGSAVPDFTGRLVIGTNNPAGLLAMGQMMTPALAQMKLTADGKPVAVPAALSSMLGQPMWAVMDAKALGLGFGAGEDTKLTTMLKQPGGNAGQLMRMNLSGAMYANWIDVMEQKSAALTSAAKAMAQASSEDDADAKPAPASSTASAAEAAQSKAQFAMMKAQAERIDAIHSDLHMDDAGLVISSQTTLK